MLSNFKKLIADYQQAEGINRSNLFVDLVLEIISLRGVLDRRSPLEEKTWLIVIRIMDILTSVGLRVKLCPMKLRDMLSESGKEINHDVVDEVLQHIGNMQTLDQDHYFMDTLIHYMIGKLLERLCKESQYPPLLCQTVTGKAKRFNKRMGMFREYKEGRCKDIKVINKILTTLNLFRLQLNDTMVPKSKPIMHDEASDLNNTPVMPPKKPIKRVREEQPGPSGKKMPRVETEPISPGDMPIITDDENPLSDQAIRDILEQQLDMSEDELDRIMSDPAFLHDVDMAEMPQTSTPIVQDLPLIPQRVLEEIIPIIEPPVVENPRPVVRVLPMVQPVTQTHHAPPPEPEPETITTTTIQSYHSTIPNASMTIKGTSYNVELGHTDVETYTDGMRRVRTGLLVTTLYVVEEELYQGQVSMIPTEVDMDQANMHTVSNGRFNNDISKETQKSLANAKKLERKM
jgi:hypothetical protein